MTLPIALLHGFTGSPGSWAKIAAELSPVTSLLAVALVGHGDAANATVDGFESEVDRIASLLRARAPSWHLAGYSLGGRVAIGLLVRHPDLFEGATLIGAQPGLASDSERKERVEADERWCRVLEEQGLSAFVARWEALPLFATQKKLPEEVRCRQRDERLQHEAHALARSLRLTGLGAMPSYWQALERVTIPTTLMVGEYDEKFTAIARKLSGIMGAPRAEVVAAAGHNVVLERPDVVVRALREAARGPA